MKVRLWFVRESEKARQYCKVPKSRNPVAASPDFVWIPKSLIEHTTKRPSADGVEWPEHEVTVEEWFGVKEDL